LLHAAQESLVAVPTLSEVNNVFIASLRTFFCQRSNGKGSQLSCKNIGSESASGSNEPVFAVEIESEIITLFGDPLSDRMTLVF
jgi:hypothetical protein